MQILVIEDDAGIAEVIRLALEASGHTVEHVFAGDEGLRLASNRPYSLVVLDLMLPKVDGWQICESLRAQRITTPLLMLTARDAVQDRVRGLDAGADDYLPKPFEVPEFLARVRALLRRDRIHRTQNIRVADLEIDTTQRRVWRAGVEVGLSRREYDLLEALASQESRVLTRDAIQENVWKNEESVPSIVDVYIGLLRKKIDAGHAVKLIHTIHGLGYTLRHREDGAIS